MQTIFRRTLIPCACAAAMCLTLALLQACGPAEAAAPPPPDSKTFSEINVERINLVERDGTVRWVLANSARLPGVIVKGDELPHPGREGAGMIFYNDEGTENGGLVFGGREGSSFGGLSFDQYEQDQMVQLMGFDENGQRLVGLKVVDRPDRSIVGDIRELDELKRLPPEEFQRIMQERERSNYYGASRFFAGRQPDRAAVVNLSDEKGRTRLRLRVEADGAAAIEFLDADGKVVQRLSP